MNCHVPERAAQRTGRDPYDGGRESAEDLIRVEGAARLAGEVPVAGAKNSALKLMAAALLAAGETVLRNVPRITDIAIMAEVLRRLGCDVVRLRPTLDGAAI